MKRDIQGTLGVIIGVIVINATVRGQYLNFVKPSMRWMLIASGVLLIVFGFHHVLRKAPEHSHGEHDHGHELSVAGHDHSKGSRVGWFLLVPFLLLSVTTPQPLGSYAAQRGSGAIAAPAPGSFEDLAKLPDTSDPIPMTLTDYVGRALHDESKSLTGKRVQLTGFVSLKDANDPQQGWYLTRMALNCCAADAYPVKIEVRGGDTYPPDTWVVVEGTWIEGRVGTAEQPLPILQAETMAVTGKPAKPYEG